MPPLLDTGAIAQKLVDLAFKRGSTDNIAALIVQFAAGGRYVQSYARRTGAGRHSDAERSDDVEGTTSVCDGTTEHSGSNATTDHSKLMNDSGSSCDQHYSDRTSGSVTRCVLELQPGLFNKYRRDKEVRDAYLTYATERHGYTPVFADDGSGELIAFTSRYGVRQDVSRDSLTLSEYAQDDGAAGADNKRRRVVKR